MNRSHNLSRSPANEGQPTGANICNIAFIIRNLDESGPQCVKPSSSLSTPGLKPVEKTKLFWCKSTRMIVCADGKPVNLVSKKFLGNPSSLCCFLQYLGKIVTVLHLSHQPGAFLRIYNLRAIPGSSKVPGLTSSQQPVDHLAFHLHGGTSYGRGIRVLPENSPDVQQLKSVLEAFLGDEEEERSELNDSELLEVWSTPPEFLDADAVDCRTERSCAHQLPAVSLSQVKQSHPSQVHHVRAQLRSYQPHRLHQALKLFCSSCTSIQDIPDEERVAAIFSEASRCSEACRPPPWALSGHVDLPGGSSGSQQLSPSVHLSTKLMAEGRGDQLIFLRGSTLEETRYLAAAYQNIVPVRSFGGQLGLLDLSAPFLFRGSNRYYGCKRCSEAALSEPRAEGVELLDEKIIAEALGVKLLQSVFLMKLELQDATDTLEVFLWRHAELFFSVAAADVLANQEAQNGIQQTMDMLCPAEGSMGERPWLHLCLMAYRAEGDDQQNQTCYQICNTVIKAGSKELDIA